MPQYKIPPHIGKRARTLAMMGASDRHWYKFAKAQIHAGAVILNCPPQRFADLLAIYSPRVSVLRSVRFAVHYLQTGTHAHDVLQSVKVAIAHYEHTGQIRGPKTAPFAKAIMGDESAIVLDTWMAVAFDVDPGKIGSQYIHKPLSNLIRRIADENRWTPAQAQAAIWSGIVQHNGRNVPQFYIEPEVDNVAPF